MDELKAYLKSLVDEPAREAFAAACGTSLGHLRNAIYQRKPLNEKTCVAIERESRQAVRRWHLRASDWHEIWPELVGADGAPAIPQAAAA